MLKRKWMIPAGAALVSAGILAAFLAFGRIRSPDRRDEGTETMTTQTKEEKEHVRKKDTEDQLESRKESIAVYGAGHLYYLMPEDLPAFQERLTGFTETAGIEAATARVLEDHVDDRSDAKSPAVFYLKLGDEAGTIVEAAFEKTSGRYGFAIAGPEAEIHDAGEGHREEGRTEHEIPESSEDEEVPKIPVTIADTEGVLAGAVDEKELAKALTEYLRSIDEGRREFFVSSFRTTETGYEAVLDFETVRHDGRSVEVKYDGTWHFRLI